MIMSYKTDLENVLNLDTPNFKMKSGISDFLNTGTYMVEGEEIDLELDLAEEATDLDLDIIDLTGNEDFADDWLLDYE